MGSSRAILPFASGQAEICFAARPPIEGQLTLTSIPTPCPSFDHPTQAAPDFDFQWMSADLAVLPA
jgi:hypothetical protein